jgi:hypothetical protein
MLSLIRQNLKEVVSAVLPLVAVVCVLQVLVVRAPVALFLEFLAGSILAVLGMLLLFAGIDIGILPMGRFIGAELPMKGSLWLIAGVAFALGLATTVAEPDVLVLADQVEKASRGRIGHQALAYITGVGVGLFSALALLRIVWGFSMTRLLAGVYAVMLILSMFAQSGFIPMAYDAGSVTTGVLTAPVLLALARGLTSVLGERSGVSDAFGLLGLASVGPILTILIAGMLIQ